MNRAQYCTWRGCTKWQFDKYVASGMPVHQRPSTRGGDYIVYSGDAIDWEVAQARGVVDQKDLNAEREKAGLLHEQKLKTRFENGILNREYVKAAEIQAIEAVVFTALRDRIRGVTSCVPLLRQAAMRDDELELKAVLETHLEEALEGIGSATLEPVAAH